MYRKLLEMEEALLMWEEFQRDNDEAEARKLLLSKMVEAGFPGHEKYTMFSDSQDFQSLLTFIIKISNLRCLKRTGNTIINARQITLLQLQKLSLKKNGDHFSDPVFHANFTILVLLPSKIRYSTSVS